MRNDHPSDPYKLGWQFKLSRSLAMTAKGCPFLLKLAISPFIKLDYATLSLVALPFNHEFYKQKAVQWGT